MAKTTRKGTTGPAGDAASRIQDAGSVVDINKRLVDAASRAQSHAFDRMIGFGQDYIDFLGQRLERQMQLMSDLSAVKGPGEVPLLWNAYLGTARAEYAEEFASLLNLWAEGAREAATDLRQQIEEAESLAETSVAHADAVAV